MGIKGLAHCGGISENSVQRGWFCVSEVVNDASEVVRGHARRSEVAFDDGHVFVVCRKVELSDHGV